MEEFIHITFDESNPSSIDKVVVNDDVDEELQEVTSNVKQDDPLCENQVEQQEEEQMNTKQNKGNSQTLPKEWKYISSHLNELILGDPRCNY